MSGEAQSAVALRILIRDFVSASPGNGETLQNINTGELPDGAQCFVTSTRQLFRFRKFSTAAAVANVVIVPSSGGGRWVLETVGPSGALPLFAAATNTNTVNSSEDSDWLAPNSSAFAMQLGTGAWTFTALSCVAHYVGPAAVYLARLVATVTFSTPDTVWAGIDHNIDLAGTAAGFAEGAEFIDAELADATESFTIVSERLLTLAFGDQIGPRFRLGGGNDLDIERLTLSAIPIG